MTPKERFKGICAFERVSDPFIWNIDSWYESFERWVREGMPVKNLDNNELFYKLHGNENFDDVCSASYQIVPRSRVIHISEVIGELKRELGTG